MTDRPIIFSAPMVRALLEGRKTQTRRLLKPQITTFEVAPGVPCRVDICWDVDDGRGRIWKGCDKAGVLTAQTVPYAPGDRLWVRETWGASGTGVWTIADARRKIAPDQCIWYAADDGRGDVRWWPSIHMPREFSRLTLLVTDVRVQRLLDISEADAKAEGFADGPMGDPIPETPIGDGLTISSPGGWASAAGHFQETWTKLHPDWDGFSSPWVTAISFTVHRCNIDNFTREAVPA